PRPVPPGRGQVLVPAVHAGDPGRRGAEAPGPDRPAREGDPRAGDRGQHPVRRRRVPVGAVPDEVLPDQDADPVRRLLRGGRPGQRYLPGGEVTGSATSAATRSGRRPHAPRAPQVPSAPLISRLTARTLIDVSLLYT